MPTAYPTALDAFNNPGASDALDTPGVFHDVQHSDANDAIEALQAKIGVDNSSVATSLDYLIKKSRTTVAPSAAVVPVTIRGFSGQTADLAKFQSSALADLVRITASGDIIMASTGRFALGGSVLANTMASLYGASTSTVQLAVRGFASQTAALQEWQSSAGSILAKMRPDGSQHLAKLTIGSNHAATQPANSDIWVFGTGTAMLRLNGGGQGGVIAQFQSDVDNTFVRGFIGQNAWWDVTNNVWNVENQGANDFSGMLLDNTGVIRIVNDTSTGTTPYTMTDAQMKAKTRMYFYNDGRVTVGGTNLNGQLHAVAQGDRRALSCEGFASGTSPVFTCKTMGSSGPIQEWRFSDDSVRSQVTANGSFLIRTTSQYGVATAAALSVGSPAITSECIVMRAIASQTADLLIGQNSAGGAIFRVGPSGYISVATASQYNNEASLSVNSLGAANRVVVVRAAGSQTGSLLDIQDSAGATLMRVGSGGDVGCPSIANSAFSSPAITFATTSVRVFNRNTVTNVPLQVDGMASQSGDLQQWRNSGGTPLALVDAAGIITTPAAKVSGLTGATAASRHAGGTATGAPASGTFALGDFVVAQDGTIWICTAAGTPGTWKQVSGGGGDTELLMYMGGF